MNIAIFLRNSVLVLWLLLRLWWLPGLTATMLAFGFWGDGGLKFFGGMIAYCYAAVGGGALALAGFCLLIQGRRLSTDSVARIERQGIWACLPLLGGIVWLFFNLYSFGHACLLIASVVVSTLAVLMWYHFYFAREAAIDVGLILALDRPRTRKTAPNDTRFRPQTQSIGIHPAVMAAQLRQLRVGCSTIAAVVIIGILASEYALAGTLADANEGEYSDQSFTIVRWIGGKRTVLALTKALREGSHKRRSEAAEALINIGRPAVPALIGTLDDSDVDVRWEATKALWTIGHKSAVPALITALQDSDVYVRREAAKGLRAIGDESSVLALIDSAISDTDVVVRQEATEGIRTIGDSTVVPELIAARLGDSSDQSRRLAAKALLGRIADKSAVPPLWTVRWMARRDDCNKIASKAFPDLGVPSAPMRKDMQLRHCMGEVLRDIIADLSNDNLDTRQQALRELLSMSDYYASDFSGVDGIETLFPVSELKEADQKGHLPHDCPLCRALRRFGLDQ